MDRDPLRRRPRAMSPPPSSAVSEKPDWSRPGKESSRIQNVQAASSLLWEKIAKRVVTKLRKKKILPERKKRLENRILSQSNVKVRK
ncbi:hypothetical protein GJAV_G00198720 [Gymnothorax javanicus]|nr:hypothetical protein GJAV_G00198720 [Gymnothorax javanicus]